ncbi:MAG: glycosyltransferase [Candidatus Hodarchaeota archaeon]
MLKNRIYYYLKPVIPRNLQIFLRRQTIPFKKLLHRDTWPIHKRAGRPPHGWSGWPDQKKFALVLTHDVETAIGQEKCHDLIRLEKDLGFRSSFYFVPERYSVSLKLLHYIASQGFEVGVHGLKHDGRLYHSQKIFKERAVRINHYLKKWGAVGFRSPSTHHNLHWLHFLNIDYDASTFDTDPFEPQPKGVASIFPFFVPGDSSQRGYVELPYTLPQDFTLFLLMKENSIQVWKQKLDWIVEKGGMALLLTHPDYMNFGGGGQKAEKAHYPAKHYTEFLYYIKTNYEGLYWHALPKDIALFHLLNLPQHIPKINFMPCFTNLPGNMKTRPRRSACMLGYFPYDYDARVQSYVNFLQNEGISVDIICLGEKNSGIISDNGAKVSVFTIKDRKEKEKSRIMYILNLTLFFILAMYKVSFLHFKKKYQFIHVHNLPDFLVFAAWIPKLFGSKILLDIHDILPEFYARKYKVSLDSLITKSLLVIEKISCRFSDHVIVANETWRDRLVERSVNRNKCTSLPNFPDRHLFSSVETPQSGVSTDSFRILYHGSLTEHHGLDIAIKALDILRHKIGPIKFTLYGGGPSEFEIRSMIRSLGLENIVEIKKPVPHDQVPKILKNADIGVVPKRDGIFAKEAVSTKLFQYVAMGIPAVVSRTEAEKRYFGEDEVKYFTPEDPEDMAKCIQELYENPEDRYRISQRALRKIDDYSLDNNKREYLRIINSFQFRKPTNSK